jgi:hypothetical protein
MKTIAIMQPTYLPWLGYFDLIDQVDDFVLLDDVEFSRQSWQQRNRIKTAQGEQWLTMPVLWRGKSDQKICAVMINLEAKGKEKHLKTIMQAYAKAPFLKRYIEELSEIMIKPYPLLVELNIALIYWFCQKLGITTNLILSSKINAEGKKVERLINICKYLGATKYLSPPGSKVYIDENDHFPENGIELQYQNYQHPVYKQLYRVFLPFMSTLDLLFNEGTNSLSIIRSGRVAG